MTASLAFILLSLALVSLPLCLGKYHCTKEEGPHVSTAEMIGSKDAANENIAPIFPALAAFVQCRMPPKWKEKPEYRSTEDLAFVLALRLIVTSSHFFGHKFSHLKSESMGSNNL